MYGKALVSIIKSKTPAFKFLVIRISLASINTPASSHLPRISFAKKTDISNDRILLSLRGIGMSVGFFPGSIKEAYHSDRIIGLVPLPTKKSIKLSNLSSIGLRKNHMVVSFVILSESRGRGALLNEFFNLWQPLKETTNFLPSHSDLIILYKNFCNEILQLSN